MKIHRSNKNIIILIVLIFVIVLVAAAGTYIKNKAEINTDVNDIDVSGVKVNKEFLSNMSEKELIHYKIMNSIDLFDTASGEYYKSNNETKVNQKIFYTVDVKNRKGHQRISDIENDEDTEIIIKDGQKVEFDNYTKTYREFQINIEPPDEVKKLLKPEDRYSKSKGYIIQNDNKYPKDKGFIKRNDEEFLLGASESLFNQDYLVSYLENYDNWNVAGDESYLGRACVKISGKLDFVGKYGTSKFTALIDKETGILLKFENLNNDNKVVDSLEMKSIVINKAIAIKAFEKDLTGYKKIK